MNALLVYPYQLPTRTSARLQGGVGGAPRTGRHAFRSFSAVCYQCPDPVVETDWLSENSNREEAASCPGEDLEQMGRMLARAGVLLFLASLVNGVLIQALALPRLALSAHLFGLIGASF